jgi:acid stress-induced BolA-like protein IbaG/YrbA
MQTEEIKSLIEQNIPEVMVTITGDGTHFEAVIVSDLFNGKTLVQQHQIVYRALGDKMGTDIHALSLQTYTPEQWEKHKDLRVI